MFVVAQSVDSVGYILCSPKQHLFYCSDCVFVKQSIECFFVTSVTSIDSIGTMHQAIAVFVDSNYWRNDRRLNI